MPANAAGIHIGQDIYFLGFPFGLGSDVGSINRQFPLPFIKKGVLSSIVKERSGANVFYLDGNNNPGFSGGPVVFAPSNDRREYQVAAVISGYRLDPQPIYAGDQPTQLSARHNTGIVISYDIGHALMTISANPIGCPVGS